MNRVGWCVSLLFGLVLPAPARAEDKLLAEPLRELDAYVVRGIRDWKVPALAVAVVRDDQVVFRKAYGVLERGSSAPATTHTLFAIGSTTKAMTAAALGMLVDEGRLRWDEPVIQKLPSFLLFDPYLTREVTVKDLLTHRAGLPNADFLWYRTEVSAGEILRRFALLRPETSLRSHFTYQNIMYHAAGELIAAVSGMPWAAFVEKRIFEPLGMGDSLTTAAGLGTRSDVASPHFEIDDDVKVISNASVDSVAAAGAVWSSVEDMAKWVAFLLRGGRSGGQGLLKEATFEELFTPQAIVGKDAFYPTARLTRPHWTSYGLGWFQQDYAGRALDFHTGSIDGMVAICGLIRDEKLGVVVLANLDHAELRHAIMLRVFDLFGPGPRRDWSAELLKLYGELREEAKTRQKAVEEQRVSGTKPSRALEAYAGTYADPLYGTLVVSFEGALRMRQGPELQATLEHWNYDTFRAQWDLAWLGRSYARFELDTRGTPRVLELEGLEGNPPLRFERQEPKGQ